MFKLYTWNTPNGQKPLLLLEELRLFYKLEPIDLGNNEQKSIDFLKINPNGKIPALVHETNGGSVSVFESGAILQYIAELDSQFWGDTPSERARTSAWLNWQVGGLGPMIGQWGFFITQENKVDMAIERYFNESVRLLSILDNHLSDELFLNNKYSIADMACYPWVVGGMEFINNMSKTPLPDFPSLQRWADAIGERPATIRAMEKAKALSGI